VPARDVSIGNQIAIVRS